jgi:cysteine synthase B
VKDRAAKSILREAERSGRLHKGVTILDATSGNTGIAYAMISAAFGYRLKLCMPANVTPGADAHAEGLRRRARC